MLFACVRACRAAAARGHVRAHSAVTSVARSPLKDALTLADASSLHPETKRLLDGILAGDRMSLARGITLIESTRVDHKRQAELLLDAVLDARRAQQQQQEAAAAAGAHTHTHPHHVHRAHVGVSAAAPPPPPPPPAPVVLPAPTSFRVGLAGPPGAGKSTLIEALGMLLVGKGHRVAVVAVDPSSSRGGGSILGDKTRMTDLSRHENAFVRPSPTRGALGGVAEHTNDVVLLCEGAGYDIVLVETVGLGQSEVVVDATVDMLLLVVPPAGGDELQGVKKGIVEVADAVVVNKADGDLAPAARHAAAEYKRALQLVRPKHGMAWLPDVVRCSAATGAGVPEVWECADRFRTALNALGRLARRRQEQSAEWMWSNAERALVAAARADGAVSQLAASLQPQLLAGTLTPRRAAAQLVRTFALECAAAAVAEVEAEVEAAVESGSKFA